MALLENCKEHYVSQDFMTTLDAIVLEVEGCRAVPPQPGVAGHGQSSGSDEHQEGCSWLLRILHCPDVCAPWRFRLPDHIEVSLLAESWNSPPSWIGPPPQVPCPISL
jgi:hypothetical protein